MTTGIEVRRSTDDALLITNLKRHPQFVGKGTVVSVANTETDDGLGSVITVPDIGYLRAIIPPVEVSFHLISKLKFWLNAAVGTSVDWYAFGELGLVATNIGIEVYDDAGVIMFNSNPAAKPMKIVLDISGGIPVGKDWAIINGGAAVDYIWEDGAKNGSGVPDPSYYALIRRVRTSRITSTGAISTSFRHRVDPATGLIFGETSPDFSEEGSFGTQQQLVVDVTDY